MSKKDKKKGVVYSTNKDFSFEFEKEEIQDTLELLADINTREIL